MHNLLLGLILIILIIGFFPGLAIAALWIIGGLLVLGLIGFVLSRIILFFKNLFFSLDAFVNYCHHNSWKTAFFMWMKVVMVLATIGVITILLVWGGPVFVSLVGALPDLWTKGVIVTDEYRYPMRHPMGRLLITAIPCWYVLIMYWLVYFVFHTVKEIKSKITPNAYNYGEDYEKTDL